MVFRRIGATTTDEPFDARGLLAVDMPCRAVESNRGQARRLQQTQQKGTPAMTTDEILQVVGAIYQATLNVDEGDEREALRYIHDCAGMILDEGWLAMEASLDAPDD
jgi:hypothetical protein